MFSGGRDSSLSAIKLYEDGFMPTLVTVTSSHLSGIESVTKRLKELKQQLPGNIRWLQIKQPSYLFSDQTFYYRTCLPCQQAYVVIGSKILKTINSQYLAMGYVGYQRDWPEQTQLATNRLQAVLLKNNINLLLPVYNIESKEDAGVQLKSYNLSSDSLEQKCLRQITNIALDQKLLEAQIDEWEKAIGMSLNNLEKINIEISNDIELQDI